MAEASIRWELFPFEGRSPARLAGIDASLALYQSQPRKTESQVAGPGHEAVLRAVALKATHDPLTDGRSGKSAVQVTFPQLFQSAPDWDLIVDATGTGAAVMQNFGGGWNDLLYVTLVNGRASEPVRISGQNLTSPRLVESGDGHFLIYARSRFNGLLAIDPKEPAGKGQSIGDKRLGLSIEIGGGESAWIFLGFNSYGPLSLEGMGAAPAIFAIGPTGKMPSHFEPFFDGAPLFDLAAASSGEGFLMLATGPNGVQSAAVDQHGTVAPIPLDPLSGNLSSPSVAVRLNPDGSADALFSVLLLDKTRRARSIALASVDISPSGPAIATG